MPLDPSSTIIPSMDFGLALIDKQEGRTSRSYDAEISRKTGIKKVGHLGTLDPFASGLLVVAVGKATKFLPYIDEEPKCYLAVLSLGRKTDTADITGNVVEEKEVPAFDDSRAREVLDSLKGEIEQVPPSYSAVKIHGKPAYSYARRGKEVELKARKCFVHSINLIGCTPDEITFTCSVSKGTYVRTLGEEIATRLGTLGHLVKLRRLSIGKIIVNESMKLEGDCLPELVDPARFICLKRYECRDDEEALVRNGVPLELPEMYASENKVLVTHKGETLAVYAREEGLRFVSERGLF